jgi:hypothetical protein
MLNKIQTVILEKAPKLCTTSAQLHKAMDGFAGSQICTFIGLFQDNYFLMYTTVVGSDIIDFPNAVAFEAPCPPFCTKGGGGKPELFAWS